MKKTLASFAVAATVATGAYADGGVIKFGHDNKTDPFENPAHACTAVFSNLVTSGTNGSVTVEVFGSNIEVEYTDGSRDVIVSDGTWKLTTDGPIRANNEYDGDDQQRHQGRQMAAVRPMRVVSHPRMRIAG